MNGAAALLVLRLVLPICDAGPEPDVRAPAYVRCADCGDSWVTITESWCIPSAWVGVRDQCGRQHYHDSGREYARYHCVRCCREWAVEGWTGSDCWCGWTPEDNNAVLMEPCPDISDEWTPEG